ncbi:MAG: AAA family ATPase [Lachnospiraceae bacterium]|nr:AAA family ATPase [Lachnospiraceae bacterium]
MDKLKPKLTIIINGVGGAGKDTLCDYISTHFETINVSSITPIKDIARNYGWDGEKDEVSRKFLADLKKTFIDFNDLPTEYLVDEYEKFIDSSAEIFFAHIREAAEIDKFKARVKIPCVTLLIRREENKSWGNCSDDDVEKYAYDYYFENVKALKETQKEFCALICKILSDKK